MLKDEAWVIGGARPSGVFTVLSLLKWHLEIELLSFPFPQQEPVLETPAII